MKKTAALLALLLALGTTGCSSQAANTQATAVQEEITVVDQAFTCTPDDLVQLINDMATNDEDGVILQLGGEYTESGDPISAEDTLGALSLTLTANEAGNLVGAKVYWDSSTNDRTLITSAGAYCGLLLSTLSPSNAEAVYQDISDILSEGMGKVDFSDNGVDVSFMSMRDLNYLTITVAPGD